MLILQSRLRWKFEANRIRQQVVVEVPLAALAAAAVEVALLVEDVVVVAAAVVLA